MGKGKEGQGWGGFATQTAPLDPPLTAYSVYIFFTVKLELVYSPNFTESKIKSE